MDSAEGARSYFSWPAGLHKCDLTTGV